MAAPKTKRTTTKTTTAKKSSRPASASSSSSKKQQIQPKKPAVRVGTLITVLLFIAIVLFAFWQSRQKKAEEAAATPTPGLTYVFDQKEGNPTSIEVRPAEGEVVQVSRNEKNAWTVEQPIKLEADQGLAEAAASQLKSLVVALDVEDGGELSTFGLDKPKYTINVTFDGGKTHKLDVGDVTPSNSGYYVLLDGKDIMVVKTSGIDALTNLVTTPPYLNTPTPTATPLPPTSTPVPPTETLAPSGTEFSVTPTP